MPNNPIEKILTTLERFQFNYKVTSHGTTVAGTPKEIAKHSDDEIGKLISDTKSGAFKYNEQTLKTARHLLFRAKMEGATTNQKHLAATLWADYLYYVYEKFVEEDPQKGPDSFKHFFSEFSYYEGLLDNQALKDAGSPRDPSGWPIDGGLVRDRLSARIKNKGKINTGPTKTVSFTELESLASNADTKQNELESLVEAYIMRDDTPQADERDDATKKEWEATEPFAKNIGEANLFRLHKIYGLSHTLLLNGNKQQAILLQNSLHEVQRKHPEWTINAAVLNHLLRTSERSRALASAEILYEAEKQRKRYTWRIIPGYIIILAALITAYIGSLSFLGYSTGAINVPGMNIAIDFKESFFGLFDGFNGWWMFSSTFIYPAMIAAGLYLAFWLVQKFAQMMGWTWLEKQAESGMKFSGMFMRVFIMPVTLMSMPTVFFELGELIAGSAQALPVVVLVAGALIAAGIIGLALRFVGDKTNNSWLQNIGETFLSPFTHPVARPFTLLAVFFAVTAVLAVTGFPVLIAGCGLIAAGLVRGAMYLYKRASLSEEVTAKTPSNMLFNNLPFFDKPRDISERNVYRWSTYALIGAGAFFVLAAVLNPFAVTVGLVIAGFVYLANKEAKQAYQDAMDAEELNISGSVDYSKIPKSSIPAPTYAPEQILGVNTGPKSVAMADLNPDKVFDDFRDSMKFAPAPGMDTEEAYQYTIKQTP